MNPTDDHPSTASRAELRAAPGGEAGVAGQRGCACAGVGAVVATWVAAVAATSDGE